MTDHFPPPPSLIRLLFLEKKKRNGIKISAVKKLLLNAFKFNTNEKNGLINFKNIKNAKHLSSILVERQNIIPEKTLTVKQIGSL